MQRPVVAQCPVARASRRAPNLYVLWQVCASEPELCPVHSVVEGWRIAAWLGSRSSHSVVDREAASKKISPTDKSICPRKESLARCLAVVHVRVRSDTNAEGP